MAHKKERVGKPTYNAASRLVSKKLGQFRLLNLLGVGGQAAVYLAKDELNDTDVGLKVFPRNANDPREARLLKEARIAAGLKHPHIVEMLSLDNDETWHWVAMEFCNGGSLQTELKQRGPLSVERVRLMIEHIADGLHYAHVKGLIHRDVKPGNVLLDCDGDGPEVMKLADFGLAAILADDDDAQKAAGTPYFLAPEVWQGKPCSAKSDIYALGVTAFDLLAGRHMFDSPGREQLAMQHICSPVPDLKHYRPELPDELLRIIYKCLHKDPSDRFSDALELSHAAAEVAAVTVNVRRQASSEHVRVVRARAFDSRGIRSSRHAPSKATSVADLPAERSSSSLSAMGVGSGHDAPPLGEPPAQSYQPLSSLTSGPPYGSESGQLDSLPSPPTVRAMSPLWSAVCFATVSIASGALAWFLATI